MPAQAGGLKMNTKYGRSLGHGVPESGTLDVLWEDCFFFCLVSIIQTGAPWKQIQFTFNASMDRTEHIAKLMRGCGHPEWRWWRHFLIRQIPGAQFNWWKMQLLMWNYSN